MYVLKDVFKTNSIKLYQSMGLQLFDANIFESQLLKIEK